MVLLNILAYISDAVVTDVPVVHVLLRRHSEDKVRFGSFSVVSWLNLLSLLCSP